MVGDIHGYFAELQKLLKKINFSEKDVLVAVGDLVDRGPGTWDVARFFHETPNAFSVLGNHERRLAGTIRGTSDPAWSQRHTLSKLHRKSIYEIVDEFGEIKNIFLIDVPKESIGKIFYMIPRNNPIPVAPLLIQNDPSALNTEE